MEIKNVQIYGIVAGLLVIISAIFLRSTKYFLFLIGVGIIIAVIPFVFSVIQQNRINSEKEEMFLEFTRSLVESVKTGTPISKSIINTKAESYGVLSDNVKKLANQISLGIPLNTALKIFANDVNNKTISRTVSLIGQAEKAGGDIGTILESVTSAVRMSDKLKKERKAAISTLVTQGYIIFFIFTIIVLIMQFKIMPMLEGIGNIGSMANTGGISEGLPKVSSPTPSVYGNEMVISFLYLFLVQGFFTGLTIGKLAEGNIKAGIKHSFALMFLSFLISTGANILFGG